MRKNTPPDYKGQPRATNGQFASKAGSRTNGRSISATSNRPRLAGTWNLAPYNKPTPNRRPGQPSQGTTA